MLEQKSPPGIIARAKREIKLLEALSDLNDQED